MLVNVITSCEILFTFLVLFAACCSLTHSRLTALLYLLFEACKHSVNNEEREYN